MCNCFFQQFIWGKADMFVPAAAADIACYFVKYSSDRFYLMMVHTFR